MVEEGVPATGWSEMTTGLKDDARNHWLPHKAHDCQPWASWVHFMCMRCMVVGYHEAAVMVGDQL